MASPTPPVLVLPERYSVLRHVANGGMASVWEARDERLGRHVAVKVLSAAYAADDAARRRFTREARAAARLSTHPHVVTVYDTGEHDGQAFLVMALYTGGTVAERLARGPIARPVAMTWLRDAAGALDVAHAEGVVHRDVKPANLLLDAADRVAVADFGIATAAWETSVTSTGMVLGTMAYLAPEQRTGGAATPASDRYALGLVARELLTGARPGAVPSSAVSLPGAAELALERATAEDPAARPPSCAALIAALDTALDASDDVTAATRPGSVAPRTRMRPPAPIAVPAPVADPTTAAPVRAAVARSAPVRAEASPAFRGPPSRRGRMPLVLALLVGLALLAGIGAALLSGRGDDSGLRTGSAAATSTSTSTKKRAPKKTKKTTSASSTTSSSSSNPKATSTAPVAPATTQAAPAPPATTTQAAPPPATTTQSPTTQQAPAAPASGKSRSQLVAQNNRAFAAIKANPAAQVAPLQEAKDGLCTDESDVNCAYALFNLAKALRLSGQAAAAIPLLERRLEISNFRVADVRAELAAARAAA